MQANGGIMYAGLSEELYKAAAEIRRTRETIARSTPHLEKLTPGEHIAKALEKLTYKGDAEPYYGRPDWLEMMRDVIPKSKAND